MPAINLGSLPPQCRIWDLGTCASQQVRRQHPTPHAALQTFLLYIPRPLREKYENTMLRLIEQNQINARMRKASAACTLLCTCLPVAMQGSSNGAMQQF